MHYQPVGVNNFFNFSSGGDFMSLAPQRAPLPAWRCEIAAATFPPQPTDAAAKCEEQSLGNLLCWIASARPAAGEKSEVVFDVSVSVEGEFSDDPN
jgi:hypothetical protein